jgi:Flp pilus assembly protein TadG
MSGPGVNRMPKRRGAAVVEFAIVAPLLFAFIFGIIEFGRMLMVQQVITSAAREGARQAILPGGTNATATARMAQLLNSAGISGYAVSTTPSDVASADADDPVSVTVTVPYANVSWVTTWLPLQGRVMSASCVMRKETSGG